jgi:HEAT repeat protein
MEKSDEIREAKDILQTLIKAKKNIRMYPENNPIYRNTLEDTSVRFTNFLDYRDEFKLQIKQNSISYESEELYSSTEKEDNLALFFFKDGLRELTFKKGLLRDELEEFLKIIAREFDREEIDDDIVTLLWEKDFQNIQYVVDEAFLVDIDEEDYETKAEKKVKEQVTDDNDLMRAYADGFSDDDRQEISIVPITDRDLQILVKELEKDSSSKIEKLVSILFELVYQSEKQSDVDATFQFLRNATQFCMRYGDIALVNQIMKRTKDIMEEPSIKESGKNYFRMLSQYLGNEEITGYLAETLDSSVEIDANVYEEFVGFLDKNAIQPLIKYLAELKTIRARKNVIDALIILGRKDIQMIAKGLDDQRWYLVRNIIYILRKIADKRSTEYLLRTVRHSDIRVRKEGIKALGELGGRDVIQTLRECLDDPDTEVRITAAKAFGTIGSEVAKKIIFDKISNKMFKDKDFDEKKEVYEVLLRWKDQSVFDFLMTTLRKKTLFGRAKNDENRACAAFCLGLLGKKDALPDLRSLTESNNKLLKDFAHAAIRKLEHDQ